MIRKWIRKIVNEVMEETMNEIQDNADLNLIEEMAAKKVAERIDMNAEDAYNYLKEYGDFDARDIAEGIDLYDLAYQLDKEDIASEINLSDVADEIDVDDLASYVSDRMSDNIEVNYEEVASNMVMAELAKEIDVNMIACLLVSSDKFAKEIPNTMEKALEIHDAKITNMLGDIVVSLNKIINGRLQE